MGDEDYRSIENKDNEICVGANNELSGSDSVNKKYKLCFKSTNVAILHPSFLCPLLKKSADDLHIIILGDACFYNTFDKAEGKDNNQAGPALSGIVNRFLKISAWDDVDKTCHASQPVFNCCSKAIANIEVHYLWNLNELDDYKLTNHESKLFAQIHPEVVKMYKEKGLVYGFEVIIKDLPLTDGLYDLSWVNYAKAENEEEKGYFYELQDAMIDEFNKNYRKNYLPLKCSVKKDDAPVFSEEKTEIQSYHPLYISSSACLNIGHLSDVHISSRQHVFTKSKARLIDGQEGDAGRSEAIGSMVNTSYATLKSLMKKMADDTELLIFTGDLIDYNRNFNPNNSENGVDKLKKSSDIWKVLNLKNLKNKTLYPVGIDNLVIYELFKWYYNAYKKPIMLVSGNHEAYTLPYGISPRVKFTRSLGKALSPGKYVPVLDENGEMTYDEDGFPEYETVPLTEDEVIDKSNEEADDDVDEAKKKEDPDIYFDRANEGIPADHNLTIPEAILMYGPDYARIVMAAASDDGGERNFKPENLAWFYHIFTPLSSFISIYAEQCFIGLGWGDNEKFVGKKQGGWTVGGFLPRATESVSDSQLELLNSALEEKPVCKILCSHFTYANYNTPQAISETGEINTNDLFGTLGKHDYGTFETNRNDVYKAIIDNKIKYTLSGHSHRSGLYQIKDADISWLPGRDTMSITAQVAKDNKFSPLAGCRMLVAACGGPIAVQNHNNELFNWGLDSPSGNYIQFNGIEEAEVGIKIPDIVQAKPRLAVALDYADIFLREKNKYGLIKEFYSKDDDGEFILKINDKANMPEGVVFKYASLVFYERGMPIVSNGIIKKRSQNMGNATLYEFYPENSVRRLLEEISEETRQSYICFQMDSSEGNGLEKYNTQSNWIYQIEITARSTFEEDAFYGRWGHGVKYTAYPELVKELERIKNLDGYTIYRHRVYGEVPNFGWHKIFLPNEYE